MLVIKPDIATVLAIQLIKILETDFVYNHVWIKLNALQ